MGQYTVTESLDIGAPAGTVYKIFADYLDTENGHPAILPPEFTALEVKEGGIGAGTKLWVSMETMGAKTEFNLDVSELEPGRVLFEEDVTAGVATTFTVDPQGGDASTATISITGQTPAGFVGWLQALITPPVTRRILKQELKNLDQLACRL